MNNILDYVKPLVDKIYRREPDCDYVTENGIFNIVINFDDSIMEFERETIDQVVDFVLE